MKQAIFLVWGWPRSFVSFSKCSHVALKRSEEKKTCNILFANTHTAQRLRLKVDEFVLFSPTWSGITRFDQAYLFLLFRIGY